MDVPEIDVDELESMSDQGVTVIDVRQPDEYEEYHVPGARLIPLNEVPERLDELPTGERFYVICETSGRSRRATEYLVTQGYDAVLVIGGSRGWADAGFEVANGSEPG